MATTLIGVVTEIGLPHSDGSPTFARYGKRWFADELPCRHCEGEGITRRRPCPYCHATGVINHSCRANLCETLCDCGSRPVRYAWSCGCGIGAIS